MAGIKDLERVQRDLVKVQRDIKAELARYKNADGDRKARSLEKLKEFQEDKKELDAKLDNIVGSLHSGAEYDGSDD